MGSAPVLSRFRLVSRCRVLLERPIRIAEVLLGPRKYDGLKNVVAVEVLVDSDPLFHENEGVLPLAQIPPQTITDAGFWRCSTMADVPGASEDQILSF